ncbi:penicillin-binding transpeptidase domain-containing protein [Bacillus toyonensis]|uniref:serine-type D-Ala-D-Ala carboxypeptidase n=1 Tax=Bacillus toyonensis TaxID=155322 RepID=A0A2A8HDL5_9BACI|nr:penicillin-binding transpeptidase domain-containing protein [Bacillus toyonensis]PEQ05040.1 hypothetical protein CN585_16505 [Bacillus toyonensis]
MKKLWMLFFICFAVMLVGCNKNEPPKQAFEEYINLWNDKKFANMYVHLSDHAKKTISKKEFTEKYQKIYEGIGAKNLKVKTKGENTKDKERFLFEVKMDTDGGTVSFIHEVKLVKEKESWKIDWTPDFIFPGMKKDYKVRMQIEQGKRGEIYDRNGKGLATNGKASEVGIIPEKLGETAAQTKEIVAQLLDMSTEEVEQKLTAKWIKPDSFVPIGILKEGTRQNDYIELEGVSSRPINIRTYPLGEAAAHLTGYIGKVNAEELKSLQKKGYQADDLVGKTGLEKVLENKLRGEKGGRVFMEDENGKEIKNVAKKEAKEGENVTLTIDAAIQEKIFNEMKNEAGSSAAVNPKTGETIALVSSPAYNPNILVRGASKAQREAWNNDSKLPMMNRFTKAFVPGSVFKTITGAIGLETKTLNPKEEFKIQGLKWTKDSSWGNYYVTRVNEGNIPSPHLLKEAKVAGNWKENVLSKKNQEIVKSALIKVINDPDGAGRIAKVDGVTLAGKTGTAELKESKEADGKELGWFAAFDANAPDMIVTMMIEDVKGRGGSNVPGEKVKHVFQK